MKQQILNLWSKAILFECDVPDGTGMAMRHALEKAVEDRADLTNACLANANLTNANLTNACLTNACLTNTCLTNADLIGTNLTGAKWRDGIVINKPPIQVGGLLWFVSILDQHMQIGCELHSLHDWERFDERRIAQMDGRDAVRFWRAHGPGLLETARGAGRSFEVVTEGT